MATIHISEADAAKDFSGVIARARAGEVIVVESDNQPAVTLRASRIIAADDLPRPVRPLRLSESIARAKARADRLGYETVPDEDFAADMEQIISKRRPADHPAWD